MNTSAAALLHRRGAWVAWTVVWLLVASAAGGCGSDAESTSESEIAEDSAGDVAVDVGSQDIVSVDTAADTASECPGGPFCGCTTNDGCDSGLCIPTPKGRQCAKNCVDSCSGDFDCKPVAAGSDTVTICVPKWGQVCRPCAKESDCAALGISSASCVSYGDIGAFCGIGCAASKDCPIGTSCKAAKTIDGAAVKQCVRLKGPNAPEGALFGLCSCSPAAQGDGAATTCWLDDLTTGTARRCKGVRQCSKDGLSACELLDPPACVDAQCDGATNGTPCDDGDACTTNDVCTGGTCTPGTDHCECHFKGDCTAKDAGNPCLGSHYCDKSSQPWRCAIAKGSVVTCDDGADTACLKSACDPATGKCALTPVPGSVTCTDADPCSVGDTCVDGSCKPGTDDICSCHKTADCSDQNDDKKCNGTLYCDKSAFPYTCKVNPATVKKCPSAGPQACRKNLCNEKTLLCEKLPVDDGSPCDDGYKCTFNDFCKDGACVAPKITCQCLDTADCGKFEDGNVCNGTLFCDKVASPPTCKLNPASVVSCPTVADTACAKNTCQAADGSCKPQPVAQATPCHDGHKCTVGDHCDQGKCTPTTNTCACKTDADCSKHDDGDLCNGTMFCSKTGGGCLINPATKVACKSVADTACSKNQCQPKSGKCAVVNVNEDGPCDDANKCTSGDTCIGGYCAAGKVSCECQKDGDCAGKNGGDLCVGSWICDKSGGAFKCVPNPFAKVNCATVDDTACQKNQCQKKTGKCVMVASKDGVTCDDGDPCNEATACAGGKCAGGKPACECQKNADCQPKDDGNPCNGTLYCQFAAGKGSCAVKPGSVVTCQTSGDSACRRNTCDAKTGSCAMAAINVGKTCDDGDPCTLGEVCAAQKCGGGKAKPCGGGDACATKSCNPKTGACDGPGLKPGDACNDSNACTGGDKCVGASCIGTPKPCDDGNSCTAETCDKAAGTCTAKATGEGLPCNADNNKCTPLDACNKGTCKVGAPLTCSDGNPCTSDACDKNLGKCVHKPNALNCSDGQKCTLGDKCSGGTCKPGEPRVCKDGNACTDDSCNTNTGGCLFAKHARSCSDGSSCTIKDRCSNGKCSGTLHCSDGNPCTKDGLCGGKSCNFGVAEGWEKQCGVNRVCIKTSCQLRSPPAGMLTVYGTGPAGYVIGCNGSIDKHCQGLEHPNRTVRINGFYIDRYEVTAKEYLSCVKHKGCTVPSTGGSTTATYKKSGKQNHPINYVRQNQARSFCEKMRPKGRLCSEPEWEWAAAGKGKLRFPWGHNNADCFRANWKNCGNKLKAVGGRPAGASWIGAQDMAGNAWEWVRGWYLPYSHAKFNGTPTNPWTSSDPGTGKKPMRGGSYRADWPNIRTTKRLTVTPKTIGDNRGFRCCADMPI